MDVVPKTIEQLPAVLQWLIEWLVAPITMLWLGLRWILWGPVLEKPGDALTLEQRRVTKEATAGGVAVAAVVFLIVYTALTKRPIPPDMRFPAADRLSRLLPGLGSVVCLAVGLLASLLPRPLRHWAHGRKGWFLSLPTNLALAVWLSSGIAVFSLLSYFECREAHGLLLAGFVGLAVGYRRCCPVRRHEVN